MGRALSIYVLLTTMTGGLGLLALFSPGSFLDAGVLAIAAAVAALCYLFPATFLGIAVLSLVTSPEFYFTGFMDASNIKALHRLVVLLALAVNIWRYGWVWRPNPPIVALLAMFAITLLAADFLPYLTEFQMIKSLIALILPFLFLHCVYRRDAIDRYLTVVAWMPLVSVAGGLVLQMAGIRNVAGEEHTGAVRLEGMNIAAHLAMYGYAAFFVCVYRAIATGRHGHLVLAGINFIIILATGTRMPTFAATLFGAAVMVFVPQASFSMSARVKIAVGTFVVVAAALFALWPLIEPRIIGAGTSGRSYIWDIILDAIDVNPWFGRGSGAGAVLLLAFQDDWRVHAVAAHNEYLRILVDFGIGGLAIFVAAMARWIVSERRFMRRDEWVLFLGIMVTFAVYSYTSNTISAQQTLVIFFALALVIQRARQRGTAAARPPAAAEHAAPSVPPLRPPPSTQSA